MDPTPYTPAGDLETVLENLETVEIGRLDGDTDADETGGEPVLPMLDAALDELADRLDAPEPVDDESSPHDEDVLCRQRAEFDAVAATTDVDSVPFDDAATFLASSLYAVPPANTRFQWVDDDGLVAD